MTRRSVLLLAILALAGCGDEPDRTAAGPPLELGGTEADRDDAAMPVGREPRRIATH